VSELSTDPGVAEGRTIWELLERRAQLTPDLVVLLDEHGARLTAGQLRTRTERVAAGLYALGIGPGTPVTWQLPTRLDTAVLMFALARLGAVQNPVISLYRRREVASLLATTGARWYGIVRQWRGFDYAGMAADLVAQAHGPISLFYVDDGLPEGDPAVLPAAPTDADEVRWLYSTSGTTAEPKAVRHSDGTLMAAAVGLGMSIAPAPDDVAVIPFPIAHIGGPDQLLLTLRSGMPSLLMEGFVPQEAAEVIRRHGGTMVCGSTAHYLGMLAYHRAGGAPLPSLRTMVGGGAPKPAEVFWQVRRELGARILHGYGMTECPMIAIGAVSDTDEQLADTEGAPVHGCEIRVLGPDDLPVPTGIDGEIEVRGPMLAKGYTDPVLTAESFREGGWFRTGDRGHLRSDGHVVVTGRTKELIIRKGENISPREIEDLLMALPEVAAVAVIGLPDPERGERVCAVVERPPSGPTLSFQAMRDACVEAGLMPQKVPEQLEVVDALPRNPTMKVLKSELIRMYGESAQAKT
jgi:cyclohexanecarboxylate-CoA ligase